ncbi:NFIL3 like protein [Pempheris klunzingeri]|uniref:NFIL3 like protein n=1 Tax=Pempheris klunzingeri TaxID=3127111 RepID=UPI003980F68D
MSSSGSPDGPGAAAPCQPSSSGCMELLLPVAQSSLLARGLLSLRACSSRASPVTRRKREMIPANRKDATYWDKRVKNNEAARRSREKRRLSDLMMQGQLLALNEENAELRARVLSLQYHSGPGAQRSHAGPAPIAASTLPSSPGPAHAPALFQTGLWSSPASVLSVSHPFEANIPCLSSTRGVGGLNAQSSYNCCTQRGIPPLLGPRVRSPRAVLEGGGSAEAELDAQLQVSSSDDIRSSASPHPTSPIRVFLPTPDTHPHASILSYPAQNWRLPYVGSNFLLPWRSPPAVYRGLPLYIEGRQGQALGEEADPRPGLKSRFSSAHAGLHLSPYGR